MAKLGIVLQIVTIYDLYLHAMLLTLHYTPLSILFEWQAMHACIFTNSNAYDDNSTVNALATFSTYPYTLASSDIRSTLVSTWCSSATDVFSFSTMM